MRNRPHHLALILVAALAAGATVTGRLGDRRGPPADPMDGPDVCCLGLALPPAGTGLSCGASPAHALAAGVRRLRLPSGCAAAPLPPAVASGDLLELAIADGSCRVVGRRRLEAARRLIAGVGIDVNRDPAAALELLPGIGPVRAAAIVEQRERAGPFAAPADLVRVRGIGTRTVERLRPWLAGAARGDGGR
jgi:competence ComEA-like helix-hairpin-helix protein